MTKFGFVPTGFTLERYQSELKKLEKEIQVATDKLDTDPTDINRALVNDIKVKMENVKKDIERAVQTDRKMKQIREERQRRALEAEAKRRNDESPRPRIISIK